MPDRAGTHGELYDLLPHRHPILLVDRIVGWEPGVWIETVKTISGSEPCYAGLAPSLPLAAYAYPPALLLESFVQSAAALWARTARADGGRPQGTMVFAGAKEVSFHRPAFPGDSLLHRVRLAGRVGSNAFLAGETTLGGANATALTVVSLVLAVRPASFLERLAGSLGPTGPTGPAGPTGRPRRVAPPGPPHGHPPGRRGRSPKGGAQ
jgi:3-hydroxyacyl-[acyl-carrier-protein] dehydratase